MILHIKLLNMKRVICNLFSDAPAPALPPSVSARDLAFLAFKKTIFLDKSLVDFGE